MNRLNRLLREILLGPAYFYHKRLIRLSKKWTESHIDKYQNLKIHKVNNTETNKEIIYNNLSKFTKRSFWVILKKSRTGGTTGEPFVFYQDIFFTRQKERAYIFDIWKDVGYKAFDYRIIVRGNNPRKGIHYNFFENALIISQDYFCESNKKYLLKVFSKKPFYLHTYPSSLIFLIQFWGIELFKSFPIRGVMAGSESFPASQMKWFKSQFKIPVSHWYGHSEYAILGRYCDKCNEFHFYPTYGKASLKKTENYYQLMADSFNKYGTTFNNYFTGDYAIPTVSKCDSDNFFKVKSIIGREQEFVFDKNGNQKAFGPYLFGIHSEFWEMVKKIQFEQRKKGYLLIKYIPQHEYDINILKNFLKNRFKEFHLEFKEVKEIYKTKSGKHKYFIQKIKTTL